MFPATEGWTREDSDDATLLHEPSTGTLWAWKQHAPLARVVDLAPAWWPRITGFSCAQVIASTLVVTASGATANVLTAVGQRAGADAIAMLAFVVQQRALVVLGGVAAPPARERLAATLRGVIDSFAPEAPARRFLYPPPRGWHGQAQDAATMWYAPEFPRTRATLTVSPAEPKPPGGTPHHVIDAIVEMDRRRNFAPERAEGPDPIASRFGLAGFAWAIVGTPANLPRLWRDIVVLGDDSFVYTFILGTLSREERDLHLPALTEAVLGARSVQPGELVLA